MPEMRRKLFVNGVLLAATALFAVSVDAQGGAASAQALKNPVPSTAASVTAGAGVFKKYCAFCHGVAAQGNGPLAPEGSNPPDLTDATWLHGSTDGDIFTVIADGAGADTLMISFRGKVPDQDLWHVVNYLRSLGPKGAAH
jgi:mono/diheme cytochrome c family protein